MCGVYHFYLTFSVSNDDYIETNQILEFTAGETSRTVQVAILADTVVEDTETFNALLTSPSAGATLGVDTAMVSITDATGQW